MKKKLAFLLCLALMLSCLNAPAFADDLVKLDGDIYADIKGTSPEFSAATDTICLNNHTANCDIAYDFYTSNELNFDFDLYVYNEYSHIDDSDYNDWLKIGISMEQFYDSDTFSTTVEKNVEPFGLPATIVDGEITDRARVSVNTTLAALREAFAATDNPNTDVFHVDLVIGSWYVPSLHAPGNVNYVVLRLWDSHVPLEEHYYNVDFDSLTLETEMTPELEFCDEVPEISSITVDWYSFIYVSGWLTEWEEWTLPEPVDPAEGDGESVDGFAWPNWELGSDPFPDRFERYFGDGMNVTEVGQSNGNYPKRGPERFVYGVAANKTSKTGTSLSSLGVSLSDFMNTNNASFFNALPGLNQNNLGYYTEEESWDWGEDGMPLGYTYAGMLGDVITVTFTDGVVCTFEQEMISGSDNFDFRVVGDTVTVLVPDYVLNVPADKVLTFNKTENYLGSVNIRGGENFPEDGRVYVTVSSPGYLTRTDGGYGSIPFKIGLCGNESEFLAGTFREWLTVQCDKDGALAAAMSIYVKPEDWANANGGSYSATISFTSKYVAP